MDNDLLIFQIIRSSIWGTPIDRAIDQETYDEIKQHALLTLSAPIISTLNISETLRYEWKQTILQQVAHNVQSQYIQSEIPLSVPYVILKGTSAAQYYPYPEYRTMGDIDIITRHEDHLIACETLVKNGYSELLEYQNENHNRHRSFTKLGIVVEIHSYFAMLNNPQCAEYLDKLIIDNINSSHLLPDQINGLVLLEHINQHLEEGLGLRQIIDWMMFVDKCLPDEKWPEFQAMARKIGLESLAIVTTHMCEMYLGLNKREWCSNADEELCEQLMDYIFACGNFGNKRTSDEAISENVFAQARTPRQTLKLLQIRGLHNWTAAKKNKLLRPFAWIYQIIRYFRRGVNRDNFRMKLIAEYKAARKRNTMFEALGIKTADKGIAIYKDGKYTKE